MVVLIHSDFEGSKTKRMSASSRPYREISSFLNASLKSFPQRIKEHPFRFEGLLHQ